MKITDLMSGARSGVLLSDMPSGVYLVSLKPDGSHPWLVMWDPCSKGTDVALMDVEDGEVCGGDAGENYVIRQITELSFR